MFRLKKDKIDDFIKNYRKLGFIYHGNQNRGDNWIRYSDKSRIDGIMIQGSWSEWDVCNLHPYATGKKYNIKDKIKDLLDFGYIEEY